MLDKLQESKKTGKIGKLILRGPSQARHVELARPTAPRDAAVDVDADAPPSPPGSHVAPPAAPARVSV